MDSAALYAAIVESTDDVVIAKSLDGTVLSWNAAAERVLGWSEAEMIGESIRKIIPAERQAEEDAILAHVHAGERVETFETERLRKDGSLACLAIQVSPVRDAAGTVIGASKIARDITGMLAARAIRRASDERFRLMGDNLPVIAYVTDGTGAALWGNRRYREFFGVSAEEIPSYNWSGHIAADQRDRALAEARAAARGGEAFEMVLRMTDRAGAVRWMLVRTTPLAGQDGLPSLRFGTGTDITAQREADERTHTLLKEVNHRTRNMLAMIQSMARRTAAVGGDFVPRLECRIAGLAATQDLLVRHDWDGVPLTELIEAQLGVAGQPASRVTVAGPEVEVSSGAAESVGMALNELAINAGKYGALSVPEGRVELHWSLSGDGDDEVFALDWREHDGPAVTKPEVVGFGSRIIEDVPRGKLCGAVEIAYAAAGFHWRLTCPAALALVGHGGE